MTGLADHFPTGCWHQPDDSYAGECSCGRTFIGNTYAAAKQAWATHATTPGGDLLEQAARVADEAWASAAASVASGGGLVARARADVADTIRVRIRALKPAGDGGEASYAKDTDDGE